MAKNTETAKKEIDVVETETHVTKETQKVEPKKTTVKQPRQVGEHELIEVRNITYGSVGYKDPKNQMVWRWDKYGSKQRMSFVDIMTMYASYPTYLTTPILYIEDRDVVYLLNLEDVYDNIDFNLLNNLEGVFELTPEEMKQKITKMNFDTIENFKTLAVNLYKENKITDLNKIKVIKEMTKLDLELFNE